MRTFIDFNPRRTRLRYRQTLFTFTLPALPRAFHLHVSFVASIRDCFRNVFLLISAGCDLAAHHFTFRGFCSTFFFSLLISCLSSRSFYLSSIPRATSVLSSFAAFQHQEAGPSMIMIHRRQITVDFALFHLMQVEKKNKKLG